MNPERVTRLAAVVATVPDPGQTVRFLGEGLGLACFAAGDGRWHVTADGDYGELPPRRMLTLVPGIDTSLDEVVFETHSRYDFDGLAARLQAREVVAKPVPADREGGSGLRFQDPFGLVVSCRSRIEGRPEPLPVDATRPRRLGHVNVKVPDPTDAAGFYQSVLNLLLSERVGEAFWFLRVSTEHHNLAFRSGADTAEVHHIALEVHGWESYRPILDRLADLGVRAEYGPGRHAPGRNLFVYVRDPSSGLRFELFADMAHIYDEESYVPKVWGPDDRPKTINRYGPFPPDSFL